MAYIGTSPANGVRRKHTYTATAGQTSFSGNDDNGVSLVYVDTEYLDVYQNGVKLVAVSDYASTTGTSVVLVQGASVDDIVEIIAFDIFSVADTVSAGSGGSFGGNVGMGGTLAVTGVPTFTGRSVHSGGITVANAGQIGSVGDADAIAIASGGVVTFSQNTVGAGGMDLILSDTISSAVADYDITSTYINSSYDSYYLVMTLIPVNDNVSLQMQVFVGGTLDQGANYGSEIGTFDGGAVQTSDSQDHMDLVRYNVGSAAGEGFSLVGTFTNINATNLPFSFQGTSHSAGTAAAPVSAIIFAGHKPDQAGGVVNGIRIDFSGGNIESGSVQLYGLRK
jgi:hypothetical protein